MKIIHYDGEVYPAFQAEGFAAKFCFPFIEPFCKGRGLDVGCNRIEWSFPGSIPIDPLINPKFDAFNLPAGKYDYIVSSHMLEHVIDWVGCLDYWKTKIKEGGYLCVYLPSYKQKYWRPWNNRKHIHIFNQTILYDYLNDRGWEDIITSGDDANSSFLIIAKKPVLMSRCGIYSITNKFTGKRYIGSTTDSFYCRWKSHKSDLKHGNHHSILLQRSYNKRGLDAFRFEILLDCSGKTTKEIHEIETRYIDQYNGHMPKGYNIKNTSVGNSRTDFQDLLLFDIKGVFIGDFKSSTAVSKKINVSSATIQTSYKRQAIGKYSSIKGKWIVIQKVHLEKAVFEYPYQIYEITEKGEEVDSFYKFTDAGKKFNIGREGIRNWIKYSKMTPNGTFLIVKNNKYPDRKTHK